jgi:hypothetical protein
MERAESARDGGEAVMKPYAVIDCEQRTPAWYAARVGRLTGSHAERAIKFYKKQPARETDERRNLRARLVCERLTGRSLDDDAFGTRDMQRGIELEGAAAAAYEAAKTDAGLVRWSGFLSHNELMVGCSLDGYVGVDVTGIIEIKCPKSTTHLEYLQGQRLPEEYEAQVMHNLWVSGAEWLDFVSFDDRFPEPLQLFKVRVTREQLNVAAYEQKALAFLAEVDRDIEALRTTYALGQVLAAAVL